VKVKQADAHRDTARSGIESTAGRSPRLLRSAEYATDFNSEWKLDREKARARYGASYRPAQGLHCPNTADDWLHRDRSAARPGVSRHRPRTVRRQSGYNLMGEGVTVYLPVFNAGAWLFLAICTPHGRRPS